MDDVVAVEVRHGKGEVGYFLTWGRIFDVVDPTSLEALVGKFAHVYGIAKPTSVKVCYSLQSASYAPFFYEGVLRFSHAGIPFGTKSYPKWRAKTKEEMLAGRHLYYCGRQKNMPKLVSKATRRTKG